MPDNNQIMPSDDKERKNIPIYSGFVQYFPNAITAIAKRSKRCNEQHNPGEPLHWAIDKSTEELDSLCRHMVNGVDQNIDDAVAVAWRAMANLERKLIGECRYTQRMESTGDQSADPSSNPKWCRFEWKCANISCIRGVGCAFDTRFPIKGETEDAKK